MLRSMDQPDITVEGVLSEVEGTYTLRPFAVGRGLRHQGHSDAVSNQLDDGLQFIELADFCLLYTSPSPRDRQKSRMPSSA